MKTVDCTEQPELLRHYIRSQWLPALQKDPDTTRAQQRRARKLVRKLARMTHELPRLVHSDLVR